MIERIGTLLVRRSRRFEAAAICALASRFLPPRAKPLSFRGGTLTILTSPEESLEVQSHLPKLVKRLNQKLGRAAVRQVKLRIGTQ